MTKLDIAKKIIKEYFEQGECGIFDSQNIVGDDMINIFNENGLKIDICLEYEYFEVFGLSSNEFEELKNYYNNLFN